MTLDICVLSDDGIIVGKITHLAGTLRTGGRYKITVEEVEPLGDCDVLQTPSEISTSVYGHTGVGVSEMMQRYALLAGWARRTDEEEEEVQRLLAKLMSLGCDPGWRPVARSKRR